MRQRGSDLKRLHSAAIPLQNHLHGGDINLCTYGRIFAAVNLITVAAKSAIISPGTSSNMGQPSCTGRVLAARSEGCKEYPSVGMIQLSNMIALRQARFLIPIRPSPRCANSGVSTFQATQLRHCANLRLELAIESNNRGKVPGILIADRGPSETRTYPVSLHTSPSHPTG